ncbi:MAG: T9SS type A sorting domain-containing protein [Pedobacter sp.]|nr:MAG: T9SS type A sorting domain-containing protein [Pedobacter sp.]
MVKNVYSKILLYLTLTLFTIAWCNSYAQILNRETNVAFLRENAQSLKVKNDFARENAFRLAKDKGWETLTITPAGAVIALQGVDELGLPIYFITDNNGTSAATTGTNKLYLNGGLGLNLSGSTIPKGKVAIWDGGAVAVTHQEFAPNRVKMRDNATTASDHATHVAGTIMAAGVYKEAKGMAFALPELSAFDFNSDQSEMSSNAASLLISNHSYGNISGWYNNTGVTPSRWEFWGTADANEDFKFGYYNDAARQWDLICYNAPYYLPVKSSGNNRSQTGPAIGANYFRYNESGTMVNAGPRPEGISSNNGYDIISTSGNAKNILTVGAINPLPFGPSSPSSIRISTFSSWGPTDDGRIKPDLVGNGVSVTSTTGTNGYGALSGTSMSAPNVSGSLVLLQELYGQQNQGTYMRSATLKALVLGTATEAGTHPGPDYIYGWGLLNSEKAAQAILNKGTKSLITETSLAQGATQVVNLIASGNGPLIATICWTDPEATPVPASTALNNRALRLINDLDIRIKDELNNTYSPWVLDPANPSASATTGDNFRDNVEQIYIENAIPGRRYTLTVSHKSTLTRGPQAFSIVATGVGGSVYCASAPNSNADSKIVNFKLANIDHTSQSNCTTYSDLTNQTINLEKGRTYPLSLSLGTCGINFNKIAKVFIDWNSDGDFDDEGELTATSPAMNGNEVFTTNIIVPDVATVNNISLLRVVLVETNAAANVLACGNYAKGETQDYKVNFTNPTLDVGVQALVNTNDVNCANTNQRVIVRLKNFGTQSISSIPVTVTVSENSAVVASLTANWTGNLPYLNEVEFTLPTGFNAQAGKTYSIIARTNMQGDLSLGNDAASASFRVNTPPVATSGSAIFCTNSAIYNLSAQAEANATVFWYKNPTDITPIHYGRTGSTSVSPQTNKTFYVGINDFTSNIGPKNKSEISEDGGYNQFTTSVTVNTLIPMAIESAKLYIGNAGQIKFNVINSAGINVSSVLLDVTPTNPSPGPGVLPNNPADQGRVYPLNLNFPAAGTYTITIEYFSGATIFRNNNSVSTNYPYKSELDLFSIVTNSATASGNLNYFKEFYYYLYDIKIRAGGCVGGPRLAVKVSDPVITLSNGILSSDEALGNQWFLNGERIIGAVSQTFTPTANGRYSVEVSSASGCIMRSAEFTVTHVLPNPEDINLKAYPVPTKQDLTVSFEVAEKSQVNVRITNLLGQTVFKQDIPNFTGFYHQKVTLSSFSVGMYVLSVRVGSKNYGRKVFLIK